MGSRGVVFLLFLAFLLQKLPLLLSSSFIWCVLENMLWVSWFVFGVLIIFGMGFVCIDKFWVWSVVNCLFDCVFG